MISPKNDINFGPIYNSGKLSFPTTVDNTILLPHAITNENLTKKGTLHCCYMDLRSFIYTIMKGTQRKTWQRLVCLMNAKLWMKIFCMVNGGISWRYHPPLWVFPPSTWGMWPCIIVITNVLGHVCVYRVQEQLKG